MTKIYIHNIIITNNIFVGEITVGEGTIILLILNDNKVEINKTQPYVEIGVDEDKIKELR